MGFLSPPKVPKPDPAANPAVAANSVDAEATAEELGLAPGARSLVSTSSRGLRRRPDTQRTSLIGG